MSDTTRNILLFKRTDEELLSDFIRTKEHRFYDELYQRHHDGMRIYVQRHLQMDRALAEDAVQGAWLGVYKHHESYEPGRAVKSWLYSIACKGAINIIKARNRRPTIALHVDDAATNDDVPFLEQSESRESVRAACELLCAEDREAVALVFFDGLTHRKAAKQLGIPVSTFKSRLYRGLDTLRSVMRRAA